jgi:hypothetical protein
MVRRFLILATILVAPAASVALAEETGASQRAWAAVEPGLTFLQADDTRWRAIKGNCASCHQGAMSVVAYSEAKKRGFSVDETLLSDILVSTKTRFVPEYEAVPPVQNGSEIPSLAMPLLTLALDTRPGVLTADELARMARYIINRQQPDGGWPLQPRNPSPVFDSRETFTTWLYLGLEPALLTDKDQPAAVRKSREKARAWLDSRPPADTTQYAALRLLMNVRAKASPGEQERTVELLLRRQNPDGGWSQAPEFASDAYATGQALYALSLAGVKSSRKEIRRAVEFLVAAQRQDGSWEMIPRATPEREASKNLVPITYFGAAWATIGLVRSLPESR